MTRPLRIANCSGFYGDRLAAAREMVDGGPIDVLTGDWLAELTMLVLAKNMLRDNGAGYARTFVTQMEQVMGQCLDRGIKVVSNAGGLTPDRCAEAVAAVAAKLGLDPVIGYVEGDNLVPRLAELRAAGADLANLDTGEPLGDRPVLTANAYLGGWGIAEALARGADIVITGRVTDAALALGPAAWHHGWRRDDWDALAGAVVAGHVIECGAQATGGNFAFFTEVPGLEHPGFPIAEVAADGSSVITKHPGHGGMVSVDTVTAQLLYEIGGPAYLNPDVTARFDSIRAGRRRPGPGAHLRRARGLAAGHGQGRAQLPGWLAVHADPVPRPGSTSRKRPPWSSGRCGRASPAAGTRSTRPRCRCCAPTSPTRRPTLRRWPSSGSRSSTPTSGPWAGPSPPG